MPPKSWTQEEYERWLVIFARHTSGPQLKEYLVEYQQLYSVQPPTLSALTQRFDGLRKKHGVPPAGNRSGGASRLPMVQSSGTMRRPAGTSRGSRGSAPATTRTGKSGKEKHQVDLEATDDESEEDVKPAPPRASLSPAAGLGKAAKRSNNKKRSNPFIDDDDDEVHIKTETHIDLSSDAEQLDREKDQFAHLPMKDRSEAQKLARLAELRAKYKKAKRGLGVTVEDVSDEEV